MRASVPFFRRALPLLVLALLLALGACRKAGSVARREMHPDGDRYVEALRFEPEKPGSAERWELWVGRLSTGERRALAQGLESLCGFSAWWIRPEQLAMDVPESQRDRLNVADDDRWESARISVAFHEKALLRSVGSPSAASRLILVQACEAPARLWLRHLGQPNFDPGMRRGWDDPSLAGELGEGQMLRSIRWQGEKAVTLEVEELPGPHSPERVLDRIEGIQLTWRFKRQP